MPEDFFGRGVAPFASPFTDYMQPKTLSQQRAAQPSWLNVGGVGRGDPFGQSQGDISGAGWQNPIDLFTIQAEKEMAKLAGQGMTGPVGPQGASGPMGSPGGKWANIDRWDSAVQAAASKYGVDPNRLKAHMMIESGGDPNAVQNNPTNGNTYGMMQINPAIWENTLRAQGIDMRTPEGNIMGAAYILSTLNQQYGSWDAASSAYFTGNPSWQGADTVNGTTGSQYQATLNGYIAELASYGGGGGMGPTKSQFTGGGNANSVVQTATSFVGKVPYVLGGIPGKGQTPTSWDCSGMMFWLDQNYGDGSLPMGSHEQYTYGQTTGRLSMNGPQVGDLVFFNTGASFRGNGASHVGMYIGNGQFVHAANGQDGTIISDFNSYTQMYQFMGSMKMSWSGGGAYSAPMQGGTSSYGGGNLMAGYSSIWSPDAPWRSYQR